MRTIYLDYNATTPLDPAVCNIMTDVQRSVYGNPSSAHRVGRHARALLDSSRERVAATWQCRPSEVVFTNGGTESVNLAILGAAQARKSRGSHIVTCAIEHHAVLRACQVLAAQGFETTYLQPDAYGQVSCAAVQVALRPDTILVSIMAANNQLGTLQPIEAIGALCHERGVCFHTDAVQWFGKQPFSSISALNADLVSFCAHKVHGPKGIGTLFVRAGTTLMPLIVGGSQEYERRAGTENLAAIVALAEVTERFLKPPAFNPVEMARLRGHLVARLATMSGVSIHTPLGNSIANTLAVTVAGCPGNALTAALDLEGICVSGGAACSAGSTLPSHVLQAIGLTTELAGSLIRFSLGRETTESDIDMVTAIFPSIVERIRRAGPQSNNL